MRPRMEWASGPLEVGLHRHTPARKKRGGDDDPLRGRRLRVTHRLLGEESDGLIEANIEGLHDLLCFGHINRYRFINLG